MWTSSVLQAIRDIESRAQWSREQALAHQSARFRALVTWAWRHSPFYRELFQSSGIAESCLPEINVRDLPIINKEMLMEGFDRVSEDPAIRRDKIEAWIHSDAPLGPYAKKYVVMHTSGTGGTMGLFVHDKTSWTRFRGTAAVRGGMKFRLNPIRRNRLAYYGATHGRFAGITSVATAPRWLTHVLPCSVLDPIERTLDSLNRFQPELLAGYPSAVGELASRALAGDLRVRPHYILTGGEVLTQSTADHIEEAFDVRPVDTYSASECMNIAMQRKEGVGLSIMEDENLVEILDDADRPVPPGESGRVVLTNLNNRALPIIRYDMRDVVTRGYRQANEVFEPIQGVDGRVNDALPIRSATGGIDTVHPIVLSEFFVPGITKFQFVGVSADRIILRYTSGEPMDERVREAFQKILEMKGAAGSVQVGVTRVDALNVDQRTGKFRLVVLGDSK